MGTPSAEHRRSDGKYRDFCHQWIFTLDSSKFENCIPDQFKTVFAVAGKMGGHFAQYLLFACREQQELFLDHRIQFFDHHGPVD